MLLHDAVEQFQLQAAAPAVAKTKREAPSKVVAVMQPRQQARARQLFRTFVKVFASRSVWKADHVCIVLLVIP